MHMTTFRLFLIPGVILGMVLTLLVARYWDGNFVPFQIWTVGAGAFLLWVELTRNKPA